MNAAIARLPPRAAARARGRAARGRGRRSSLSRAAACRSCCCTGTTTTRSPIAHRPPRHAIAASPRRRPSTARRSTRCARRTARRFFLKNTAPNLAGAELQELVRAAIESNGGRITTSQNQAPRDDGRFRQIVVNVQFFATTPTLQKILLRARDAAAVPRRREPHAAAAQRVPRLQARPPGQEPEINVQLDVGRASTFAETRRRNERWPPR